MGGRGGCPLVRQLKVCGINRTEMNIRVRWVRFWEAVRHELDNENTAAGFISFFVEGWLSA